MEWTRSQLLREVQNVTFDEDVVIDASAFAGDSGIVSAEDVHVEGNGYFDADEERFYISMNISGVMICPDAITGKEIEVPFETDSSEVYVFEETDEDGVRIVTDDVISLLPAVIDAIMLEVPLQVTEAEENEYPQGDGWRIYSEAAYEESRKDRLDPRLAKLKQFTDDE